MVCLIHECTRDDGTNRETTGEGPDWQKELVRIIVGIKRPVGVKEHSKKKLAKSTWAGHVEKTADEKLAERTHEWRGNGAEEDRNCDGDCIQRVGE